MLTWYRSINCSQTALLPLGRPSHVLSAVPGHLLFHLVTPQPCWRAVGRSRSVSSASPLLRFTSQGGGCCTVGAFGVGGAAPATPISMHKHNPSLPLELPFPSGWCRWSPNPSRCRGFISGFTSTVGKKEKPRPPVAVFLLYTCREKLCSAR